MLSDEYIKNVFQKNENKKYQRIIREIKAIDEDISETNIKKIYDKSISIRQSTVQHSGSILETEISNALKTYNINHKIQVTINKQGYIIGFNQKRKQCYHIIDIVIGDNIKIGNHISEYIVLSCKVSCRERYKQDNWTLVHAPKLFILVTVRDPPVSQTFGESKTRKIITCNPKKKDDREYQLRFEDLIGTIK